MSRLCRWLACRFLVACLYVWAIVLPQPMCAVGSHTEDANRPPDTFGVVLYDNGHHSIDGLNLINSKHFIVMGLNVPVERTICTHENARVSERRNSGYYIIDDRKLFYVNLNTSPGFAYCHQCQYETTLCERLIKGRVTRFEDDHFLLQGSDNLHPNIVQHLLEMELFLGRCINESLNAISCAKISDKATGGPKRTPSLMYLAASGLRMSLEPGEAIRRESHMISGNNHYYLGTVKGAAKKDTQKQEKQDGAGWKFMRFSPVAYDIWKQDQTTGYSVLGLRNQDIDVSCDGKHWFHLAGAHCLTKAMEMPATIEHCVEQPVVNSE
jgi:hypothetical protein